MPFRKVAVIARQRPDGVQDTLLALEKHLIEQGCEVFFETETAELIDRTVQTLTAAKIKECDLIIVVGGDGSLLHAAHLAVENDLPLLGINRGRLGFLTDIYPDELEKINEVLKGRYREEKRFLLDAHIHGKSKDLKAHLALNDVVLLPGNVAHMIEFSVTINDEYVCNIRADGLIVATPTGSTAYALSGGGPILHPQLDALVLVPMFPHTLTNRPIVVSSDDKIVLEISDRNEATPYISCDGQPRTPISPGDSLIITKHAKKLSLIHPQDYNYFKTLREKLHWQVHHN